MMVAEFLSELEFPRRSGRGWMARCPAHTDRSPSLSVAEGDDGRILLRCFAGCTAEEIVASLAMSLADLFPRNEPRPGRNDYKKTREISTQIEEAGFLRANLYRNAEKVLGLAGRVKISKLTTEELDQVMDAVCTSHIILRGEGDESGGF